MLENLLYRDHVELCVLYKEMFTLDFPSVDQWKTMKNMEGPSIHYTIEDIEDRGGFTAKELVIYDFSLH